MQKPIVRNMIVGQPVIIGSRPKPPPPPVEEESEDTDKEPEKEAEEPKGLPQEILDKVFAEIEEIEQNKTNKIKNSRKKHCARLIRKKKSQRN